MCYTLRGLFSQANSPEQKYTPNNVDMNERQTVLYCPLLQSNCECRNLITYFFKQFQNVLPGNALYRHRHIEK